MKNQTMSKRSFSAGQESDAEKALRKFPSIKRALESSLMAKVGGGVEAHHYATLGRMLAKSKNYLSILHRFYINAYFSTTKIFIMFLQPILNYFGNIFYIFCISFF